MGQHLAACAKMSYRVIMMNKVPVDMTPDRIKRIRGKANLSQGDLADILRMNDLRTIRRWETGEYVVTGPASVILELIEAGQLPTRFYERKTHDI